MHEEAILLVHRASNPAAVTMAHPTWLDWLDCQELVGKLTGSWNSTMWLCGYIAGFPQLIRLSGSGTPQDAARAGHNVNSRPERQQAIQHN